MDVWTFIWLMVFLKIPIVALFLIVRWAVAQTPETTADGETAASVRGRGRDTRTTPARACRARRGAARTARPRRQRPPRVRARGGAAHRARCTRHGADAQPDEAQGAAASPIIAAIDR